MTVTALTRGSRESIPLIRRRTGTFSRGSRAPLALFPRRTASDAAATAFLLLMLGAKALLLSLSQLLRLPALLVTRVKGEGLTRGNAREWEGVCLRVRESLPCTRTHDSLPHSFPHSSSSSSSSTPLVSSRQHVWPKDGQRLSPSTRRPAQSSPASSRGVCSISLSRRRQRQVSRTMMVSLLSSLLLLSIC